MSFDEYKNWLIWGADDDELEGELMVMCMSLMRLYPGLTYAH